MVGIKVILSMSCFEENLALHFGVSAAVSE